MDTQLRIVALSDREIQITRGFNAPRKLVFDAYTKPELVRKWLFGPPGWTFKVCEIDLRVGGKYRYVWSGPEGEMGMGGVYRDIKPPERIVSTEKFDQAWYPGEAVGTVVMTETNGKTLVTTTVRYESRDARDAVMRSPMERGLRAGFDRLAELVETR
ncbi:MAG TPA: SRPBCC family protein [Gemmatimonadales bacterium]